jgi:raffinose/stachyose/melibiose transport system substrate-binding protein
VKGRGLLLTALVLVAGVFAVAAWRIAARTRLEHAPGSRVVRFAHTQLEAGIREAFAAAAREYMALHPGVVVEQIAIPRRVWDSWMRTQLIGGTAPDLLQLVNNDPNPLPRFFVPADEWMEAPNPYNAGTPLEGIPWQNTFIAPLLEPPSYWPVYLHYYGVPTTLFTMRLYYNRALLREITGSDEVPATFEEFLALCERVRSWSAGRPRPVYAIAAAKPVPPNDVLIHRLLRSMTQTLVEPVDATLSLSGGGGAGGDLRTFAREAAFRGVWDLRTPQIQAGLRLVREVGQHFQPAFLQADRDQALFYFLQGRALMIMSGSWEFGSIVAQAPFPVDVFRLPEPDRRHPDYGRFSLGETSEANIGMRGAFALTRTSRHPEVAMDFLRFLTSQAAHGRFAARSGWLPVVRGVPPPEVVRGFAPVTGGYPEGFSWTVGVETVRINENTLHLLFGSGDGVERFTAEIEPQFRGALVRDELKEVRESVNALTAFDARLLADEALRRTGGTGLFSETRRSELLESQTSGELGFLLSRTLLRQESSP